MNTSLLWQRSYCIVDWGTKNSNIIGWSGMKWQTYIELQSMEDEFIIPTSLQDKAINQLHINHMGIEKQEY